MFGKCLRDFNRRRKIPTENEYKFLLRRDEAALSSLEKLMSDPATLCTKIEIEQGFLACGKGFSLRVRHAVTDSSSEWLLTLKQNVNDRVVEIEQSISDRDGIDLWSKCNGKLRKTRWKVNDSTGVWEIDRFFDEYQRVYCVLAEIEQPEGSPPPSELPLFIAENLLYTVLQGDERYSNKKLWEVEHADNLYSEYHQ